MLWSGDTSAQRPGGGRDPASLFGSMRRGRDRDAHAASRNPPDIARLGLSLLPFCYRARRVESSTLLSQLEAPALALKPREASLEEYLGGYLLRNRLRERLRERRRRE
jgi:hypothetical protein